MLKKAFISLFIFVLLSGVLFPPPAISSPSEEKSVQSCGILELPQATQGLECEWETLSIYHRYPSNINKTIRMLEDKLSKAPNNLDALILLSRAWLTHGYVKARDKEDLIRVFENGIDAAQRAIAIDPNSADAHFFYVANLASLGDAKGLFNSLFMLPEVRRELETILELDPDHENALAMQGALYYYLPGLLGGDIIISEIYIRRALSIDPHLSSAKLYLAMNLRKQKRYDEALKELYELLKDSEPTFYPDWYINRKYALRMISKIKAEKKKPQTRPPVLGGTL